MFVDSEEGSLPRKKLRIRTYDGSSAVPNLETKVCSVEGRFKTTKTLTHEERDKYLRCGIVDSRYGLCDAKVEVSYSRKYYQLAGGQPRDHAVGDVQHSLGKRGRCQGSLVKRAQTDYE